MVVLDKTLKAPESPDPSWGVKPRKLTLRDFSFFIKAFAVTALCVFVVFYPPFKEIQIADGRISDLGIFFGILAGIASFCSLVSAAGGPGREANIQCRNKAHEWVATVLRPHLEKKYGVRFYETDILGGWNYPSCQHEGRTIEVNVHGVYVNWDERYEPDMGYPTYRISSEGVWMEKVIRPEKISFEPMTPIS